MRIGVFCSGGDAPGMNACLRAVVRSATGSGHEVVGIQHGYQGLLNEDFLPGEDQPSLPATPLMTPRIVGNILKAGGTMLHTSRCERFREVDGLRQASDILQKHEIDALIPIGGDGTFRGAVALTEFWDGQIIGCPGTIDNDLMGTDATIGFHTAIATAVEAVDKLRDTAESHERLFLIEVMGRHSGYLAAYTALAAGAEFACLPETDTNVEELIEQVRILKQRGKSSILFVVAEGDEAGGAQQLHDAFGQASCPFETRIVILGHLQRGGSPVPADRILATRLGAFAVDAVSKGESGMMAGEIKGKLTLTPFAETYRCHKAIPPELLNLLVRLSS